MGFYVSKLVGDLAPPMLKIQLLRCVNQRKCTNPQMVDLLADKRRQQPNLLDPICIARKNIVRTDRHDSLIKTTSLGSFWHEKHERRHKTTTTLVELHLSSHKKATYTVRSTLRSIHEGGPSEGPRCLRYVHAVAFHFSFPDIILADLMMSPSFTSAKRSWLSTV